MECATDPLEGPVPGSFESTTHFSKDCAIDVPEESGPRHLR